MLAANTVGTRDATLLDDPEVVPPPPVSWRLVRTGRTYDVKYVF